MRFPRLSLGVILLAVPQAAFASAECDWLREFAPNVYKITCGGGREIRSSTVGSSFSNAFNVNPAKVPNEPTPYGLETIVSYTRTDPTYFGTNFSIVKGFHKIGTGISTASNNTFYGNDVYRRL